MLTEIILDPTPNVETDDQLVSLRRLYRFRKDSQVLSFLPSRRFLIPILEEVYQQAMDFFPPSTNLILEVTTDPEAMDSNVLFVFIQTKLPPQEALRQPDRFDEEWWIEASERAHEKLAIDVEFI